MALIRQGWRNPPLFLLGGFGFVLNLKEENKGGVLPLDELKFAVTFIGEIGVLLGVIVPVVLWIKKIADGQRCQLRSEMLRIYYRHYDDEKIRQYEYENFVFCYEAYKALKGNSFIDKIYSEVKKWEVLP